MSQLSALSIGLSIATYVRVVVGSEVKVERCAVSESELAVLVDRFKLWGYASSIVLGFN